MNTISMVALAVSGIAFAMSIFYLLHHKKKPKSLSDTIKVPMAIIMYVPAGKARKLADGLTWLKKNGIEVSKIYALTGAAETENTGTPPDTTDLH